MSAPVIENRTVHVLTKEPAKLACEIDVGPLMFMADEPAANGGTDTGPMPHEILLAALGACTAMTLKVYAAHKGLALRHVDVSGDGKHDAGTFKITRKITLVGDLTDAARTRLLEIAGKCPVHKTLTSPITIESALE
jgi:putative redox protein